MRLTDLATFPLLAAALAGCGHRHDRSAMSVVAGQVDTATFPQEVWGVARAADDGTVERVPFDPGTGDFALHVHGGGEQTVYILLADGARIPVALRARAGASEASLAVEASRAVLDLGAVRYAALETGGDPGACHDGVGQGGEPCLGEEAAVDCTGKQGCPVRKLVARLGAASETEPADFEAKVLLAIDGDAPRGVPQRSAPVAITCSRD